MPTKPYQNFVDDLRQVLPNERIITDYTKRFAYGVDASFYRLIPKVVLLIDNEEELIFSLRKAHVANLAVTFRAAGTSLSGQAQSDSILIMLTNSWRHHEILDLGLKIKLGPAVIGADANKYLLPYGRKIGPDPASIDTCKIAGIAANNSSGMCCGVSQNSYHTLASIRVILNDGSIFDNSSCERVDEFRKNHSNLLDQISTLANSTKDNKVLKELIEHKYRLKNTTGYAINSLIDFDDPIDILAHLIIGSEGTLGFISSITYHTVIEHKYRASTLILFPDLSVTCKVVSMLANEEVSAVELLDYRSLKSVSNMEGLPDFILDVKEGNAALLIETRANNQDSLNEQAKLLNKAISAFEQVAAINFTDDIEQYSKLWAIRKQTFPAVGAVRETGTTVIIEDVAFPVEKLAEGVAALQQLFDKYQYDEAIIFGHALDGNLHFVFTQDFASQVEVDRYEAFMNDVCQLVAVDFKGSLKAEHGTGRNMAPFIELEWGKQGYQLMRDIKALFDPSNLLNPGVIINDDNKAHLKSLKALPKADDIVDKCIECGFCEPVCPSVGLSFTPRQRISSYREIQRLRKSDEDPNLLAKLEADYEYLGIDTCAATGLCAQRCPVGINTGDLVRKFRSERNQKHEKVSIKLANNFKTIESLTRFSLASVDLAQKVLGNNVMSSLSKLLRKLSFNRLPLWTESMPAKANYHPKPAVALESDSRPKVVYFPSCATRTMGPANEAKQQKSLTAVTMRLLEKAGFEIISPDFSGQCCGMPFKSKGMFNQAEQKRQATVNQLNQLSNNGQFPILFDTSPCKSMLSEGEGASSNLTIYEPVGFIEDILTQHLTFSPIDESIMLHVTCTSRKMGLMDKMISLANRCAIKVYIPEHIYCCGFAGDKGFTLPELNASALSTLKSQVPDDCSQGYSNSRTCEIGLSEHSGIDYQSIIYLVDKVTQPRFPK
ncbi:FAD-binding and (Fe-S)-binding domain-containing protein [Thalassotalea hakodatensis]|uniref:FAD-binding and (Fe-S)-binding domain-containing protein n=1 Tax=Thalassotalea hakodatensis TaxID=3030492 RepID=UPI002573C163|nr:FAD-binding and (Fe-S)-binding domain-containing protein [Thalassotalea hakodatensis]